MYWVDISMRPLRVGCYESFELKCCNADEVGMRIGWGHDVLSNASVNLV